ncbi:hypothetical protein R3P38DRAFT_3263717 [Favolaschia claudopus]|uniref:MYND-type domain-containing protein n=1 Tax=Favolaschia claudopus TaxID=2862362 RepID=A0AAW0C9T6_9AGAR
MHPRLRPDILVKLSPPVRLVVETALAGSVPAAYRLGQLISQIPQSEALNTLPYVFAHLDPSGIPSASQTVDADLVSGTPIPPMATTVELALCASTSLSFFSKAGILPIEVCPDLWPRFWKWAQFFDQFWDSLRTVMHAGISREEFCRLQASCITALGNHLDLRKKIPLTPGVPRILAIAWKAAVSAPRVRPEWLMQEVYNMTFSMPMKDSTQETFKEVIEGVGGSLQALAATYEKHFSLAAAPSPNTELAADYLMVAGAFLYIGAAEADSVPLRDALRAHPLLPTVLTTISALHGKPAAGKALAFCLTYVCDTLGSSPGYTYAAQAFQAGLLRVLITLAVSVAKTGKDRRDDTGNPIHMSIKLLLTEILPRSLVHYTALQGLSGVLDDVKSFSAASHIEKSAFHKEWDEFLLLAEARLNLLQSWQDSKPYPKACDNLKCGKIGPRGEFQCCGGCRTANYCSTNCQTADWRNNHKQICETFAQFKIEYPEIYTIREKGFLRALLTADYIRLLPGIFVRQVIFMHSWPREPFFTSLTYSDAHNPKVEVCPQRTLNAVNTYTRMIMAHFFAIEGEWEADGGACGVSI